MPSSSCAATASPCIPTAASSCSAARASPAPWLARRAGRLLGRRVVSDVNLFAVEVQKDADDPDGYNTSYVRVGPLVGGEQLGLSVYELPPGQSICPYHYENAEEEWLIVLVGRPTLRTPDGEQELGPWDCAFFPVGEEGAHKVTNRTDETVRVVHLVEPPARRARRSIPTRTRSARGPPASSSASPTPSTTGTARSSPETVDCPGDSPRDMSQPLRRAANSRLATVPRTCPGTVPRTRPRDASMRQMLRRSCVPSRDGSAASRTRFPTSARTTSPLAESPAGHLRRR